MSWSSTTVLHNKTSSGTVTCNTGYYHVGTDYTASCSNGTFSYTGNASCSRMKCTPQQATTKSGLDPVFINNWAVTNSTGSTTGTTYSSTNTTQLDYGSYLKLNTCSTSYTKTASLVYQCTANGAWTPVSGYSTGRCSANTNGSQVFNYTGNQQTWTVPSGVTSVKLQVYGAQGGSGFGTATGTGGLGGYSYGTLSVSPGNTIYVYVGGQGSTQCSTSGSYRSGGYNGGGNSGTSSSNDSSSYPGHQDSSGGGATDIRYGGTSLSYRKIVAGGGGGAANCATNCHNGKNGGYGGGGSSSGGSAGGGGGTSSSGGSAASSATVGSSGQGGTGAPGGSACAGGGGGGGYYGGGGGTGGCSSTAGGGGSGYIGGVSGGGGTSGTRSGNGYARICWGNNEDCF